MKPLLKLLTPTISSLAIAASAICITSCNKNKQDPYTINFVLVKQGDDTAYVPEQCKDHLIEIDFEPNIEYTFNINVSSDLSVDEFDLLSSKESPDFKDIYDNHMFIFHNGKDIKSQTSYETEDNFVAFNPSITTGTLVIKLMFTKKTSSCPLFE